MWKFFEMRAGSALLIMLWAIALIAATILALARYVDMGLDEEAERSREARARELAESALTIALHPQVDRIDPILRGEIRPGEQYEARIQSEAARIPINAFLNEQDRIVIEDLFQIWGLELFEAQALVDKLADWIDPDDLKHVQGAESREYADLGFPQFPRNAPFESVEEMGLVLDMGGLDEIRPDWRDFFTVWGGRTVDLNFARAEILEVVLGIPPEQAHFFVEIRMGEDGEPDTEDDLVIGDVEEARVLLGMGEMEFAEVAYRVSTGGGLLRIEAEGIVGLTRHTITVIARANRGAPRQIIAYPDD